MTRTNVTYGQLDKTLRALGFTRVEDGVVRRYDHNKSGAAVLLPPFPEDDRVLDYHLASVRTTLDECGIADPTAFATKLQKAG
jgi:hypothetical protein